MEARDKKWRVQTKNRRENRDIQKKQSTHTHNLQTDETRKRTTIKQTESKKEKQESKERSWCLKNMQQKRIKLKFVYRLGNANEPFLQTFMVGRGSIGEGGGR